MQQPLVLVSTLESHAIDSIYQLPIGVALQQHGHALTTSGTRSEHGVLLILSLEPVRRPRDEAASRGAERVPNGERPASRVGELHGHLADLVLLHPFLAPRLGVEGLEVGEHLPGRRGE